MIKKWIAGIFLALAGMQSAFAAGELYVYIWSEYLPDHLVKQFTEETGIKVNISTYDSNEAMYTKVRLLDNENNYDLVVPSTYFVSKMRQENAFMPIDKTKLPNLKNIDPSFLNQVFDPNNQYSIPYLWGSTGLCYNSKYVKGPVNSWNELFKPEYNNKLILTDDVREVFDVALRLLSYSGNDTNEQHIKQAYEKLKTLIPHVKIFNSNSPKLNYINEEVIMGLTYNGEAYMASKENPNIRYAYPKEGVILWMDSLTIPKNAKNVDNAHQFINFLLRPEVAKEISEEMGYATPNKAALKLLKPEIQNNPTIYPDKKIIDAGEFQTDIGNTIVTYEWYWEMLKTGN